jgi:hypothetical protein
MNKKTISSKIPQLLSEAEVAQLNESVTPRCLVAIPFQQDWSNSVFNAIENIMRSVRVDVFKVDTTKRTSEKLPADVENQVRTADIVIADLTGENPNVHIEIGIAISNEKPLLLCTQKIDDVCAHLRDYLYIKYSPDKSGLAELSRQLRLRVQECLERAHLEDEARKLRLELTPIYFVECYRDRTVADLPTAFSGAHKRIDILTTNLSWLFQKEEPSAQSSWDSIKQAIEHNESLQLRVLTLNPQSEIAASRAKQLGFDPGNFRNQLQRGYDEVRTFASKYQTSRVEVRLYNELPTQITFRIDEKVLTCMVGQPMQSRNYPVLKFDVANLGVKEAFLAHFLAVWKAAL